MWNAIREKINIKILYHDNNVEKSSATIALPRKIYLIFSHHQVCNILLPSLIFLNLEFYFQRTFQYQRSDLGKKKTKLDILVSLTMISQLQLCFIFYSTKDTISPSLRLSKSIFLQGRSRDLILTRNQSSLLVEKFQPFF